MIGQVESGEPGVADQSEEPEQAEGLEAGQVSEEGAEPEVAPKGKAEGEAADDKAEKKKGEKKKDEKTKEK